MNLWPSGYRTRLIHMSEPIKRIHKHSVYIQKRENIVKFIVYKACQLINFFFKNLVINMCIYHIIGA